MFHFTEGIKAFDLLWLLYVLFRSGISMVDPVMYFVQYVVSMKPCIERDFIIILKYLQNPKIVKKNVYPINHGTV